MATLARRLASARPRLTVARWFSNEAGSSKKNGSGTPKEWSDGMPEGLEEEDAASGVFDDDSDMTDVFRKNKRWMQDMTDKDADFFTNLGKDQKPTFMYIGCADSRVPANEIMGMGPGQVFVHRNVANLVVSTDINMLSCLEYAVKVLKVKHILVTGHHGCGGVKQAMKNEALGTIDAWLGNIRDIYRLHHIELDAIEDEDKRFRRLVELNVIEQCLNLYKTDIVQSQRLATWSDPNEPYAYPRIHALVFDPSVGELNKLDVDFRANISRFQHIYDLHDVPDSSTDGSGPKDSHFMFKKENPKKR
jgi:carbonic anhydrase